MIKALKDFDGYGILWHANSNFHQEVAWFATDDDRVLGTVVPDRIDNDFGWVVLAHVDLVGRDNEDDYETSPSGYRTVTMMVSRPSQAAATEELHTAMLAARWGQR
jgi:hypothetical protein